MNALPLGRMEHDVPAAGTAAFQTNQKQKKQSSTTKQDGLKQKQNLGGAMVHPKLKTKRAKAQQMHNIEESKERLKAKTPMLKGNNFYFVCWGDITELKLWDKRP